MTDATSEKFLHLATSAPTRPPLPLHAQDSPPAPVRPPLPNSTFYVDSNDAMKTRPSAGRHPSRPAPSRPAPARPAPVRPAPPRPAPARPAPARSAPVRPAASLSKSTFYVEQPPEVPPLPCDDALQDGLSPKAGKALPMRSSPKMGKPLPQRQSVKGRERAVSPSGSDGLECAAVSKVQTSNGKLVGSEEVRHKRAMSVKVTSKAESLRVNKNSEMRFGRSKSLYQRPSKSTSPEPNARVVAVDDSQLARLRREVTGSPPVPVPPRPTLPKSWKGREGKKDERASQNAVQQLKSKSAQNPDVTYTPPPGEERNLQTDQDLQSLKESKASSAASESSPKSKQRGSIRRLFGMHKSPKSERKYHSTGSAPDHLAAVSEDSAAVLHNEVYTDENPHKGGRFSKFWGSVKHPTRTQPEAKISRRVATDLALPVTRAMRQEDSSQEDGVLTRLVAQCLGYLNRPHILKEEGLFRVPGSVTDINRLRAAFTAGQDVNLSEIYDPNTVASLLKQYFKDLRRPLIPLGPTQKKLILAMRARNTQQVKEILRAIPLDRYSSLQIMIEILAKVVEYEEYNKMSLTNVSTSCGQSLFSHMSPTNANDMLLFVISQREELFT